MKLGLKVVSDHIDRIRDAISYISSSNQRVNFLFFLDTVQLMTNSLGGSNRCASKVELHLFNVAKCY